MKITPDLVDAFLKCPTKCWLRAHTEPNSGNAYAEWVQTQNESFRTTATERLLSKTPKDEFALSPPAESLKVAKWRLAASTVVQAQMNSDVLESKIDTVERVPSQGRGKAAQFIPIRFVFFNKLTKDDRVLLAFDAFVLSVTLGHEIAVGNIIHGDDHTMLKVNTSALVGEVRKHIEKIVILLSSPSPPSLILNQHCNECEFQARCRKIAVEKDDLSLLASMSIGERQKLHSKGIFTVTQLSYTFRPRRRPKRLRDKREKYHHALKALAIREKKIHIAGSLELKIEGTPVYVDVEGLPDRDCFYLIGLRIGNGESAVQHSLWANSVQEEKERWNDFLQILETVEKPIIIHYGSYETNFFRKMKKRYRSPQEGSVAEIAIGKAINLVSVLFAKIYFPTFSNGLKEVCAYLDFSWSEAEPAGLKTIVWRYAWETSMSAYLRNKLITYNTEDCQALEVLTRATHALASPEAEDKSTESWRSVAVHTESIQRKMPFGKFSSSISGFEQINSAARWDYQRTKVYVRTSKRIRRKTASARDKQRRHGRVNKVILYESQTRCPNCDRAAHRQIVTRSRIVQDIKYSAGGLKRWIIEYRFCYCWCPKCQLRFGEPSDLRISMKYGWNFIAYVLYENIELHIPQSAIKRNLERLFGFGLNISTITEIKERAAKYYKDTQRIILKEIANGELVHVDETRANVKGKTGYVWVFTNLHEVAYLYSDSREGQIVHDVLSGFQGVIVSDFYSVYDSFACPQQRCLIHLMRELNDELLNWPFDLELNRIVTSFSETLRPMIETVDRYGLKKHFLRKHLKMVELFYRQIGKEDPQSEAAVRCKERFEKNRNRLFTFLEYDGVPWNNNNAEHAVKAFAAIRDIIRGSSTVKSIEDYLVLLSVCETCKYMALDFLDFLRSGEKDIHAFAETEQGRRRRGVVH